MEAQRNEMIELAKKNGWKCSEFDNYDSHSWTAEVWRLESVWSPVVVTAYASFLIDPMSNDFKKPDVWAIEISKEKPIYGKSREGFTVSLKQWSKEKDNFLKYLSKIRSQQNQIVGE